MTHSCLCRSVYGGVGPAARVCVAVPWLEKTITTTTTRQSVFTWNPNFGVKISIVSLNKISQTSHFVVKSLGTGLLSQVIFSMMTNFAVRKMDNVCTALGISTPNSAEPTLCTWQIFRETEWSVLRYWAVQTRTGPSSFNICFIHSCWSRTLVYTCLPSKCSVNN